MVTVRVRLPAILGVAGVEEGWGCRATTRVQPRQSSAITRVSAGLSSCATLVVVCSATSLLRSKPTGRLLFSLLVSCASCATRRGFSAVFLRV